MKALIIILFLMVAALLFSFISLEKNLKQAKKQLEEIEAGTTRTRITLDSPNHAAEELFTAMNRVMELRVEEAAGVRRREHALREQISNVSHDLRTPLTSILGYLQLVEDPSLPEEERLQYLNVTKARAKSLQELITAFYDLSRIEGGEYPLEWEQVDLYRVLSDLIAQFYGDFERSGFQIEVDLKQNLPLVRGDSGAVTRVFANLIGNALKHGESFLRISLYRMGDGLVSEFSNGGGDLTQEDAARVFDRFYTADKTRSTQNTGLGMSIVRALVRQMGHEVTAELRDGVFTVRVQWKCGN